MEYFVSFLVYFLVALALLIIGSVIFLFTTKNKEMALIAEGNKAASYFFGGRILGLAIVLHAAITYSVSLLDMVIWGTVAIVCQILVFLIMEWITPKFNVDEAISKDNQAAGLLLMFMSIAIGIVIAGCLTY